MNLLRKIENFYGLEAGVAVSVVMVFFWLNPGLNGLFSKTGFICLDSWTRLSVSGRHQDVVLVAIDENSVDEIGPLPWKRSSYASLVNFLARSRAEVLAFDLLLDRQEPDDRLLAAAFDRLPTVLPVYTQERTGRRTTGYGLEVRHIRTPRRRLHDASAALGHVVLIYDEDGIIRRIPAFISDSNSTFAAFGIAVAALRRGMEIRDAEISPGHLVLGTIDIPLDRDGYFYIGYQGGPGTFPVISALNVLRGEIPPEIFTGKIVIVGATAAGTADKWATPFVSRGTMSGIELMANVIQSILDQTVPGKVPGLVILMAVFIAGISGGLVGQRASLKWMPGLIFLGPVILWTGGLFCLIFFRKIMVIAPVAGAWSAAILLAASIKALHYRRQMQIQAERVRKISRSSATACPQDLCSILREITDSKATIGIFKDRDGRQTIWTSGQADRDLLENIEKIIRKNPGDIEKTLDICSRTMADTCNILPVRTEDFMAGLYLILPYGKTGTEDEKSSQAMDFAVHSALVIKHNLLMDELQKNCEGTLEIVMSALEKKTPGLMKHSRQVAELSREIASRMKLDREITELVYKAGMLHDLGLVGVPDHILTKKNGLSPEERVWVESHPDIGADMVSRVPQLENCAPLIRQHHERYDGKGYPEGLAGDEICLEARILAVAEAFVSIMARKFERYPGKNLSDLKKLTLAELRRCAGTQFDTKVVQVVLDMEKEIACK